MKTISKAGVALVAVALLPCYAAPAVAQYDAVPPEAQYGLPSEGQYAPPPPSTAPLPGDQGGESTEALNGGGDTNGDGTTAPAGGNGGDGGNEGEGAAQPSGQRSDGNLSRLFDGFFYRAAAFVAVLSLITTLFFFLEQRGDRRGA